MSDIYNPFVLDASQYKRDNAFLKHYLEDQAKFLSVMTGDPIDQCMSFVKSTLKPNGIFAFKDPNVVYLERQENGDRVEKRGTLLQYLSDSIKDKEIIAPTLTTYYHPSKKESVLVNFVEENIAARSRAKKAMFAAKMKGDKDTETFKNSEQSNAKISNNSLSGAHCSTSTALYNKSAHSTLTSVCRVTAGYGNVNNEKMLSGNRHYHHPDIVINNIISLTTRTDMQALQKAMDEFQIHYPTVDECMQIVSYCTKAMWSSEKVFAQIHELLTKLSPLERAAFAYVGDLYHLKVFNDQLMRDFVTELSTPVHRPIEDPIGAIKKTREEHHALATQLLTPYFKGRVWKDVKFAAAQDEVTADEHQGESFHGAAVQTYYAAMRFGLESMAATCENIENTLRKYESLIKALLVTRNVPSSLAFFPNAIRQAVTTGDTDSTIFTVQDWVLWKCGQLVIDDEAICVIATMIYLAAEAITHLLARMSANFGVIEKRMFKIAMKNEYRFDVFVPTQVGKHYYAYIGCQEGNIYMEYDMEIKGVHLKSSNVPAIVMVKAKKLMSDIMDIAASGKKISLLKMLDRVANVEKEIVRSASAGEPTYFRLQQIKTANTYTLEPDRSPYQSYLFWEEVFAPVYGHAEPPPYTALKVPVNLPNQTAIRNWINSIEDEGIRERLKAWNARTQKGSMSAMSLPQSILATTGIPKEIQKIMAYRRLVVDNTMVFYLILETLGYYCINDKITEIVSDYYGETNESAVMPPRQLPPTGMARWS